VTAAAAASSAWARHGHGIRSRPPVTGTVTDRTDPEHPNPSVGNSDSGSVRFSDSRQRRAPARPRFPDTAPGHGVGHGPSRTGKPGAAAVAAAGSGPTEARPRHENHDLCGAREGAHRRACSTRYCADSVRVSMGTIPCGAPPGMAPGEVRVSHQAGRRDARRWPRSPEQDDRFTPPQDGEPERRRDQRRTRRQAGATENLAQGPAIPMARASRRAHWRDPLRA
jgi:hypothetical protein